MMNPNPKTADPRKAARRSKFWPIYIIVVTALALVLIAGLLILADYLRAFEASQPIHAARAAFDEYFASGRFGEALDAAGFAPSEFETREQVAAYLSALREGKELTFYPVTAPEDEAKYNVVLVDPADREDEATQTGEEEVAVRGIPSDKIAVIKLAKQEQEGKWGFRPYQFTGLEMFLSPQERVTVVLPASSTLTVNGKAVSGLYISSRAPHPYDAFLPQGVAGIELCTYTVNGLFFKPALTCTDAAGREQVLKERADGSLEAVLNYDPALKEQYGQRILTGMEEYAKFIQNDGALGTVAKYFDTASLFYKNVTNNASLWVIDHAGYDFQNEVIDEFFAFDDNTFCCHVAFDQHLHMRGRADYIDSLDMTVFFRKKGGNVYIFDRAIRTE